MKPERRGPASEDLCVTGLHPSLPSRGTYALVIVLKRPIWVSVGALGRLFFRNGVYVYVGSARRGLRQRVLRHLAKRKRLHWHIDWITSQRGFRVCEVWVSGSVGVECDLAEALIRQADGFMPHFGSSDCGCRSHLLYFSRCRIGVALQRLGLSRVI